MAKISRRANYEEKKEALSNGKTYSKAEILDIMELIATKQWPDVHFSDDECNLWSDCKRVLGIDY